MSNQQPPADERQPLLAASSPTSADDPSSNLHAKIHADDVASHGSTRQLIKQELVYLSRKSPPLIVGFLLESSVSLLTVAIAGRLGQIELAIVGQGLMIMSVTGSVVALAATSAQVTLSAPIFTSPTQPVTDVGLVLQRTIALANLGMLPVFCLWWNIEPLLLALGQPPSLASGLKGFMRVMTLAMPGYIGMEAGKTFLQSQAMMTPSTWIIMLLLPIHLLVCSTLTLYTPLGVYGAALSIIVTYYLFALSVAVWIKRSKAQDCWGGWSWRSVKEGKGTFAGLWLPGVFMYLTEWLSFEIVALLAGRLGETAVAAQAGLASLDGFLFMAPFALSVVATARFGNLMGLGQSSYKRLKSLVLASFILEVGGQSCVAIMILLVRRRLGFAFTSHPDTVELIREVCLPVAMYQVFDGLQSVAAGILRATGRQSMAAAVHVFGYYCVGLPLAWFLSFHHSWGLVGLWTAQATALASVAVIELSIYFLLINWRNEIEKVERRAEEDEGEREALLGE